MVLVLGEGAPVPGEVVPTGLIPRDEPTLTLPQPPQEASSRTNYSGAETDADLIELWLSDRPSTTKQTYRRVVEEFESFLYAQGLGLRSLKLTHLRAWADALRGLPSTVRSYTSIIRSLLSFAKRTGYTEFNVGAALKLARANFGGTERSLTEEEVYALFAAASPRAAPVLRLAYYTGARASELCQLRWKNIRWDQDGGATINLLGKGNKLRSVRLRAVPAKVLHELAKNETNPESYVLVTRQGTPLNRRDTWHMVRRAAEAAGIKKPVSLHWLRHSHATHAVQRGAPVHLIQATLGHSTLAITGNYLHANPTESSGDYLMGAGNQIDTLTHSNIPLPESPKAPRSSRSGD